MATQAEENIKAQKETVAAALNIAVEDVDLASLPAQSQVSNVTGLRAFIGTNG